MTSHKLFTSFCLGSLSQLSPPPPTSKQMKVRERNICRFNTGRLFDLNSPHICIIVPLFTFSEEARLSLYLQKLFQTHTFFTLSSWSNIPVGSEKRGSRSLRSSPSDSVCLRVQPGSPPYYLPVFEEELFALQLNHLTKKKST